MGTNALHEGFKAIESTEGEKGGLLEEQDGFDHELDAEPFNPR